MNIWKSFCPFAAIVLVDRVTCCFEPSKFAKLKTEQLQKIRYKFNPQQQTIQILNEFCFSFFQILSVKFIFSFFRFSVKLWQATTIHGHKIASQSGCKLIAYTNFGMAHVISYLLLALVIYAYKGMKAADFAHLDHGIKKNLGWIVCSLFAIGMKHMRFKKYFVKTEFLNSYSTKSTISSAQFKNILYSALFSSYRGSFWYGASYLHGCIYRWSKL